MIDKRKTLKTMITFSAGIVLSTVMVPTIANIAEASGSYNAVFKESTNKDLLAPIEEEITFTNEEFFNALEAEGIDIEEHLTEEEMAEIDQATEQNFQLGDNEIAPAIVGGQNQIVQRADGTFDVYLHGAVAAAAVGVGVPAAVKAIAAVPVVASFLGKYGAVEENARELIGTFTGLSISAVRNGIIVNMSVHGAGNNLFLRAHGVRLQ